jgi:hypothetical protein
MGACGVTPPITPGSRLSPLGYQRLENRSPLGYQRLENRTSEPLDAAVVGRVVEQKQPRRY